MLKHKKAIIIIIIYTVLMIGFAFYWSKNFSRFVHYKGDDAEITVQFSILLSYAFFIIMAFHGAQFKSWVILVLPLAITLLSFIAGFILLSILPFGGTPAELTWLYLIPYTFFSITAVIAKLRVQLVTA